MTDLVNGYLDMNSSNSDIKYNSSNSGSGNGGGTSQPRMVVPVVNQPFQALLLILILISAIVTNGSVILNISRDSLKLRMVHFLLIRHVCITDSVGAIFVLPVPLISFIKGYWIWGDTACTVISTTTACCWTMHLVAVALYRADRVFAVWLPTGRYPIVSARIVNGLLVLIWATALTGSYLATYTFTPTFQPALALCIPNVPLIFFILVFASYILGLIILTTGYVFAFISRRRKRKKRKRHHQQQQQQLHQQEQQNSESNLPHHHHHHQQQSNSKSAPQLPTTSTDCCNNKLASNKQVMFDTTSSNNTMTPSTSERSCNNNTTTSTNNIPHHHHHEKQRAQTPPPPPTHPHYQTHRRSHSDNVRINQIVISNESVVSVQYRTLSKPNDDSSDEYTGVEESVAEKLDECEEEDEEEEEAPSSSSNNHNHHHVPQSFEPIEFNTTVSTTKRPRSARCRVFASYAVSIGHLILYLPAMLVVGLLGGKLPPGVAFLCGTVVYCEFIVQPIALLLVSPKLRNEVITMVKGFIFKHSDTDEVT